MDKEKSALGELWDSILYCIDSISGRFSIDSYLDVIGEYADRMIIEAQNTGLSYLGGECEAVYEKDEKQYVFEVRMYFEDMNAKKIEKKAIRRFPESKFTRETKQQLEEKSVFSILKPI